MYITSLQFEPAVSREEYFMKLRECLWIWGQDVMSHQNVSANKSWKVPDGNTLDAVAGAEYLGVPNIFRVVMNGKPFPPFDAESEKMKNNSKVIWSALGDASSLRNDDTSDVEEVIRQAEKYSNVIGAVFDDFFRRGTAEDPRWARYSLDEVRKIRSLLHSSLARKLDLWVVWYKKGLVWPVEEYLKEFDGITYWNMRTAAERFSLRADLDKMLSMTPGKKHMAGCYIWNYGEGKALTVEEINFELEVYREYLKNGKIDGIIFCSNCCADVGGAAVDHLRQWIKNHGDEDVGGVL